MFWDLEDEKICKNILRDNSKIELLNQRYDKNDISKVLEFYKNKGLSINEIFDQYKNMPELHLITNLFDYDRYYQIKEKIMSSNYGFSFNVLFSINKINNKFNYEDEVKVILRYISGSNKEVDYKKGDKSIYGRIKKIRSRNSFLQIWFLPSDNINLISKNLKKLMNQDNIFKKYDIMLINRNNKRLAKDVKEEILKQERISRENGKLGLILLAGNMLSLGITLKSCDLVLLLHDSLSMDKITQQMFRCMSEDEDKDKGFVVDLNISRILNSFVNKNFNNNKSIEDNLKIYFEKNLINIDSDLFFSKELDYIKLTNKVLEFWKNDPINNFTTLLRNLDNEYVLFDNKTQDLINQTFISTKEKQFTLKLELKDENDELQILPSGIVKDDLLSESSNDTENEEKFDYISFTKDVLKYIIPLSCILTIKNKNKDFVSMLNDIKNDKNLLDIFDDQCLIWWNKKGLLDVIEKIIKKYFDGNSNTFKISIQFKMSIQSLIDKPKELLELVNECLKPKLIEKRKLGEVFTPIEFINDNMLKDLEKFWMEKHNENIWGNKNITFYDPAAGMGNYPIAIYYKLYEGLKESIPNDEERKKHIIENMLFMAELNKKNCFLIKQIFNINNEHKMNLYQGDSLELDINKEFNKSIFDIIIGNPPYNQELKKSGAKPLYNKFMNYYLDKGKYMTYIIPSRWFAGGKGLDKFRKNMLDRKDFVFIKHFDDACSIFGNWVDIKGGVNYFLIDKSYNGLCDFNGSKMKLNKYDILVDNKYNNIIDKVRKLESLNKLYHGQGHFNIKTNNKNLSDDKTLVKCYVSKQKGFVKYIDKKLIKNDINKWKVITARDAYKHCSGFGNTFIGKPKEVCSQSYILFEVDDKKKAKSLLSYMNSKFANFMLSIRKISQDINGSTCKWIPLLPLDRKWTDKKIFKYLKLNKEDIKLINETLVVGYIDKPISNKENKKKKSNRKKHIEI